MTHTDKKTGIELIAKERQRQIEKEGWSSEHDSKYKDGELASAAACYANPLYDEVKATASMVLGQKPIPENWPWEREWWKPTPENRIRELQKAGALIAAEIDRLQNSDL